MGGAKSRWQAVKIRLSITKSRNHAISNQRIHVVSICTTIPVASLPGSHGLTSGYVLNTRDSNSIVVKCF